jgi:hypothetical protein
MPEMKQECDLSSADFVRHPVWVGVHNYDPDEPWYEQSDEETFRPWNGPLPFSEARGFVLVAATFELADGSVWPGYCRSVRDDWDLPFEASWSSMHGGNQLSVLLLQSPIIFIDGRSFDFQLRIPELRKSAIRSFYTAIGKQPGDVFPIRFAAGSGLAEGIVLGRLDGFYNFPLGKSSFEIDAGEALLRDGSAAPVEDKQSAVSLGQTAELEESFDLSLEDLQRHPVWVRIPFHDKTRPWYAQSAFVPWSGTLPIDAEKADIRIPAAFVLRDGSEHSGYVRAVPEGWPDIVPSPAIIGKKVIQAASPRVRYGDSPLAIAGEQVPCIFVGEQGFRFWCGVKDPDELRLPFYDALGKQPGDIFPIRFEGVRGLATGIVSGEIDGFYIAVWTRGKPPRVVR